MVSDWVLLITGSTGTFGNAVLRPDIESCKRIVRRRAAPVWRSPAPILFRSAIAGCEECASSATEGAKN
jgi:hypothetical protein